MISAQDALNIILEQCEIAEIEEVELASSIGRILAEPIYADRPMPPFHRVTMDGIAIKTSSYQGGKIFPIENIAPAGKPKLSLNQEDHCIEVMTGAPLPENTDCVIRYEDLIKHEEGYEINLDEIEYWKNIHTSGSDHQKDEIILEIGHHIKAIDINVLATVGKSKVKVYQLPKVALVSSGDELVECDQTPESHQIRRSNIHMLHARCTQLGIKADNYHILDDKEEVVNTLKDYLKEYKVVMIVGGVSMGKFDFIPESLKKLGVERAFYKVAQRPGKPFWYGKKDDTYVFAYPGNPVSSLACFHKYFIPWLDKFTNRSAKTQFNVILDEDVIFKPDLTYYAQANLIMKSDGRLCARISHGNGSGDLIHPSKMDGFVELPTGKTEFKEGEVYPFMPFYPIVL